LTEEFVKYYKRKFLIDPSDPNNSYFEDIFKYYLKKISKMSISNNTDGNEDIYVPVCKKL